MMEKCRTLYIESNDDIAQLIRIHAAENSQYDFLFEHVGSIAAANQQLAQEKYDLVLLDLNLAGSFGIDSLVQLLDSGLSMPLIVMTALDESEMGEEAVKLGAQDFLVKGTGWEHNLSRSVRYAKERYQQQNLLRELSLTDELTNLHNRRGLKALADQQFRLAKRRNENISLFLADVDDLAGINEQFGHQVGDCALRDMARAMKLTFRESDVLARVGGDEFVVIALDAQVEAESAILHRWRTRLASYLKKCKRSYSLSMSIGIASTHTEDEVDLDRLIDMASETMFLETSGNEKKYSRKGAQ